MTDHKKILTPHDRFFKKSLQNPQAAKQLLTRYLPKESIDLINLDTLEPQSVSFIDDALQATACDVAFRVQTRDGRAAYVYLLIEHQRNPHKLLPFRMLKYIIQLMDAHTVQNKTSVLPLVIPLVIYNGDRAYPYSMDIFDLFQLEDRQMAKSTIMAPYPMIDLNTFDARAIKDDSWVSIMLNALKYGPSKAQPKDIIAILEMAILTLAAKQDISYIEAVFLYLCDSKDSEFRQELMNEFHTKLQPILGEDFMITIADSFRQEGRQEGMQQGMQQGMHLAKLEDARKMLSEQLDEALIARITDLSLEDIRAEAEKLKSATRH